jgi:hypothetical protein
LTALPGFWRKTQLFAIFFGVCKTFCKIFLISEMELGRGGEKPFFGLKLNRSILKNLIRFGGLGYPSCDVTGFVIEHYTVRGS